MASTFFVDTVTHIPAAWANDVNKLVYDVFEAASTKLAARTALGLGTLALQNADDVLITGGSIDDTVIGITIPAQGKFTRAQLTLPPLNPQDATNKAYVDALFAPILASIAGKYDKVGGPISGSVSIAGTLTMNSTRILSVADPILAQDAATKAYVDTAVSSISFEWGAPVQDLVALAAIPAVDVTDKQLRFVEDENAIYSYDATSVLPPSPPEVVMPGFGIGRWIEVGAFSTEHNLLVGLQGGVATEYYHLTSAEYSWLQSMVTEGITASAISFDVATHRITNVVDPTGPQDAATKAYVDGLIAGTALNTITAAVAPATINNSNNTITWEWNPTAAANHFSIIDTSAGFAGAALLSVRTSVGSVTTPLDVWSNGAQRFGILQLGGWSVGGSEGLAGQVLTSAGPGAPPTWGAVPAGSPAGADTQVQYNNLGAFGASASFTWNNGTSTLAATNVSATTVTASTSMTVGTRITLQNASPNVILGEDGWTPIIQTRNAVAANTASGALTITAGTPTGTGAGGAINIVGASTTATVGVQSGGNVNLQGGSAAMGVTGAGGSINLNAGASLNSGAGGTGGSVNISAGGSFNTLGNVTISGGSTSNVATATSSGGNVTISGGLVNFATPNLVTIQGGNNRDSGSQGGGVLVTGGGNIISGPGGEVRIEGGDGFTTGDGGRVLIAAGTAAGVANDGYIEFMTGATQHLIINYDGEWQLGGAFDPGTAGQVLTSNGPGLAPTWQTPSGGASAPANQIVYGTGAGIGSDADFTYVNTTGAFYVNTTTGTAGSVSVAAPGVVGIFAASASVAATAGGNINIQAGDGNTTGAGGDITLTAGSSASGTDGSILLVIDTTGDLQINGDPGAVGEVLTSAGPGAPPVWTSGSGVAEPANQIVYGTGAGVDSDADFTWDPTTNSLLVNGYETQRIGNFSTAGDAQNRSWVLRTTTTTATLTEMLINGVDRMVLPDDTTWHFEIKLVARRTDANDEGAAYTIEGCIDRNTGAATTALIGSTVDSIIAEDTAAWDFDVTADTTNGSLKIEVQGEVGKTIRWVAFVKTVEVTG